jgi:hypothetical protein
MPTTIEGKIECFLIIGTFQTAKDLIACTWRVQDNDNTLQHEEALVDMLKPQSERKMCSISPPVSQTAPRLTIDDR